MSDTANRAPPELEHFLTTEEDALRQVAMLVAGGAPTPAIFDAVAEQIARIFDRPWAGVMQYDSAESFVVVATSGEHPFPRGSRWPLDGPSTFEAVLRTGRPAAASDYTGLPGTIAQAALEAGVVGGIAAPITVDGTTWGAIAVPATRDAPIPAGAETRLSVFTELVATAISNADARNSLALLVDEQAALRRVATLVARESSPVEIFGAVTEEARRVLGSEAVGLLRFEPDETAILVAQSDTPWEPPPLGTRFTLDGDNPVTAVFRSGETVRLDDWTDSTGAVAAMATVLGVRSAVSAPVLVEGQLWGTIIAATSQDEPLPVATESRLVQFTGLVATAIANAGARTELSRLAEEQAALRSVAVLVAQQPSPVEVFTAVTEAVGSLLGADLSAMHIFHGDGLATVVASWSQAGPTLPVGTELPLDGDSAVARIFRTRAAARLDDYADARGETADVARELRLRTVVGAPILVEGKLWGALMAATRGDEPLPEDAEARIAAFTELVATAVSNAQAREEVQRLADEQAALRRVAVLVATQARHEEVFTAIVEGVGEVLHEELRLVRYESDHAVVVAGSEGPRKHLLPVGSRTQLGGNNALSEVFRTGAPARIDDYSLASGPIADAVSGIRGSYATPIIVEGRVWGAMLVETVSLETEPRLAQFAELMATAIANTEARVALREAADEQGALRRVATLVAAAAPADDVFAAVTQEIALVLGADATLLCRADRDGAAVVVGSWGEHTPPLGTRIPRGGANLTTIVLDTREPARIESYDDATGEGSEVARAYGLRSAVGAPIVVEGRLWGLVIAGTTGDALLLADAEQRLAGFTELAATAISNATARAELVASRARIVAAGDEARRRIERNLHDGTQQRLIALGLDLQRAKAAIPDDEPEPRSVLAGVQQDLETILVDLRELSHGLHPQLLSRLGLGPSLQALARRSPIPVHLVVDVPERPAPSLETAVYYVVSEALTNAIKHSHATEISVTISGGEKLLASVVDDGVGDADPSVGSGLTGLLDRIDALGGRFSLDSPPGGGTTISIELPVEPPVSS